MDKQYEALFTPWKVGNVEIKNRIVMCPMGGTSLFGWFELGGCGFDKEAAKFFLERAKNNVGLIIPGIAPLRDTFWGKWLWQNPKMFKELKVFMDEIHATGAKLFVQLTAGMGRSWAITELVAPLHKNKFTRALIKPVLDTSHELAAPLSPALPLGTGDHHSRNDQGADPRDHRGLRQDRQAVHGCRC